MNPELKAALDAIRAGIATTEQKQLAMQTQLDAIDSARAGFFAAGIQQKSLLDHLKENDQVGRLLSDKRGKAVINLHGADSLLLSRKTTITELAAGAQTTGVLPIGRLPGITEEARQQLTLRDLLTATPTTFQVVDYVKVNAPMAIASPVAEASTKPENAVTFTSLSERIKTVAHWVPASRQILDDMSGLANFISSSLTYYLDLAEELQLLSGDNVGEDLHGLIPQASAFSTALLGTSWNKIDIVGHAIQQITSAKELLPSFVVLHPNDWWQIRLTKDSYGRYILGDPQQGGVMTTSGFVLSPTQNLFGLSVVPTTNMAQGTFLIGSGNPVATQIFDRLETQVEISTEHSTYFIQNLVAVRAEKRLCLVTRRPASFVTGTFSTSP